MGIFIKDSDDFSDDKDTKEEYLHDKHTYGEEMFITITDRQYHNLMQVKRKYESLTRYLDALVTNSDELSNELKELCADNPLITGWLDDYRTLIKIGKSLE